MPAFNLDRLNGVNPQRAGLAAFIVINALQQLSPEEQVAGATLAFAALTDKYELRHSQAFQVAKNIMQHAYHRVPELRALVGYVEGEL